MNTPIYDFVKKYNQGSALRLHMPGHKGAGPLKIESLDITEIDGADSLYEAKGIILESEKNASALFGCETLYSTEGSSLCIRAMLYLLCLYAKEKGETPLIWAGRNCHKAFLYSAALLDFNIEWLFPDNTYSYLSCLISAEEIELKLKKALKLPTAIYLTDPDYIGNSVDIGAVARACRKYGVLLFVDNAHGAYLKFLPKSRHPIDLGADICCDSAHKTLPVLTGGAYLHFSDRAPAIFREQARNALAMFGSTSPSYLILQSLDLANRHLADGYAERQNAFIENVEAVKNRLEANGYRLIGKEPLKLTIAAKDFGYTGYEIADILKKKNIFCEFYDRDFLVMMLTPSLRKTDLENLECSLLSLDKKAPINESAPGFSVPEKAMSVRKASFSPKIKIPVEKSVGRVFAEAEIGCPPAVPIIVCGEIIDKSSLKCFEYYGIKECFVVR